jgi:hypothetical protein
VGLYFGGEEKHFRTIFTTSFSGLSCEDEARDEKALVWAGHVTTKYGYI